MQNVIEGKQKRMKVNISIVKICERFLLIKMIIIVKKGRIFQQIECTWQYTFLGHVLCVDVVLWMHLM